MAKGYTHNAHMYISIWILDGRVLMKSGAWIKRWTTTYQRRGYNEYKSWLLVVYHIWIHISIEASALSITLCSGDSGADHNDGDDKWEFVSCIEGIQKHIWCKNWKRKVVQVIVKRCANELKGSAISFFLPFVFVNL